MSAVAGLRFALDLGPRAVVALRRGALRGIGRLDVERVLEFLADRLGAFYRRFSGVFAASAASLPASFVFLPAFLACSFAVSDWVCVVV